MAAQLEVITGTVQRTNANGFILTGRDGWLNISKYAQPAPAIPAPGTPVVVALDKAGFVRTVEPVAAEAYSAPNLVGALEPQATPVEVSGELPSRELVITRLAVLKAAAEFLAGKADASGGDVLAVAAAFEHWALRAR